MIARILRVALPGTKRGKKRSKSKSEAYIGTGEMFFNYNLTKDCRLLLSYVF